MLYGIIISMSSRNTISNNVKLIGICHKHDFLFSQFNDYHFRVYAATHVIDIWTTKMSYHIVDGEYTKSKEPYYKGVLDKKLNVKQVTELLMHGTIAKNL